MSGGRSSSNHVTKEVRFQRHVDRHQGNVEPASDVGQDIGGQKVGSHRNYSKSSIPRRQRFGPAVDAIFDHEVLVKEMEDVGVDPIVRQIGIVKKGLDGADDGQSHGPDSVSKVGIKTRHKCGQRAAGEDRYRELLVDIQVVQGWAYL